MYSDWEIIESGFLSPEAIMAKDAALLDQLDPQGPSLMHFYDWNVPCLTYGYFTDPARYLHLPVLQEYGLQKARRPTGGGIIFHLSDLAFSVFIPVQHPEFSLNTLDNYALINRKVAQAIIHFSLQSFLPQLLPQETLCSNRECHAFCMAKPTQYDLMVNGKKVGGAAQRRTKRGVLHQGSLSLFLPPLELLMKVLKHPSEVLEAMQEHSFYLLPKQTTEQELYEVRREIREILKFFLSTL